jgi:CRP/FNR family transcriptional regulator
MNIVEGHACGPPACLRCGIRNRSLCAALSPPELAALSSISRHKTYAPGQTIVTEGEPDVFGNIVSGIVVEKKSLSDGREQIVSLLFPADFLGNGFTGKADASVQTASPVTICTFDRVAFNRVLADNPMLRQAVLERAFAELENAREWMLLLGQKTAGERLATFLLRLATREAEAGCTHYHIDAAENGTELVIPITRAQVASYLGLTIETVSRKLTALRDAGIIEFHGQRNVKILNVVRLIEEAGQDVH